MAVAGTNTRLVMAIVVMGVAVDMLGVTGMVNTSEEGRDSIVERTAMKASPELMSADAGDTNISTRATRESVRARGIQLKMGTRGRDTASECAVE